MRSSNRIPPVESTVSHWQMAPLCLTTDGRHGVSSRPAAAETLHEKSGRGISSIESEPMSHDFAFWESEDPLENEEAGEIFASLVENGHSERVKPSAKIAVLAKDIESLWPVPAAGHEDDWPLAAPCEVSESHLHICIVPSRLWDVWPTVGGLAKQYELVMYDPQQENVFLPTRLSRKRTRVRAKKSRPPAG